MRTFENGGGKRWVAFAAEAVVAHGKAGAVLAFRPAGGDSESSLHSTVTFNSMEAAGNAIRTMSEKELRRRLSLARMAVGGR